MAKLNTAMIKTLIAKRAAELVHTRWQESDLEEARACALNTKLWKLEYKRKVQDGFYSCRNVIWTLDEVLEIFQTNDGRMNVDVLDPEPLTGDCIMRCFVNDEFDSELSPVVVSDPQDERILRISWSSD